MSDVKDPDPSVNGRASNKPQDSVGGDHQIWGIFSQLDLPLTGFYIVLLDSISQGKTALHPAVEALDTRWIQWNQKSTHMCVCV